MTEGDLVAEIEGDIEAEESVLVVKRIRARYRLNVPPEKREIVERVLPLHADRCPLARTLRGCVAVEATVEYQ